MVRRKAAYLTFERHPDLEFEFYLADRLKTTVSRLRAEMSNDEYVRWGVYFGRKVQRAELDALQRKGR